MPRHLFCCAALAIALTVAGCSTPAAMPDPPPGPIFPANILAIEKPRILSRAAAFLNQTPHTVTGDRCDRSAGGAHDFYSESDYWWPNPQNPGGPYHRKDGQTNPDNFIAHRESLMRLSDIVGTMTSAYLITGDDRYAAHAVTHLKA